LYIIVNYCKLILNKEPVKNSYFRTNI